MSGCAKNIVIGGGTGNIGRYLVSSLVKSGHNVSIISRKAMVGACLKLIESKQDCFDTFCARAQKVQNKGWRSTA